MKALIAYALIVVGLPFIVGCKCGVLLMQPVGLILSLVRRSKLSLLEARVAGVESAHMWLFNGRTKVPLIDFIAHACHDVFSSISVVFAAWLIFHLLKLRLSFSVFLIIALWEIACPSSPRPPFLRSLRSLSASLAGLIIGWLVVLRLLPL
jgi:hypothetical protein